MDTLTQRIVDNAIVTIPDEKHTEDCRSIMIDCLIDAFSLKQPPTEHQIDSYVRKIPTYIQHLADRWDWHDTEVRDFLYRWVRSEGWMYA